MLRMLPSPQLQHPTHKRVNDSNNSVTQFLTLLSSYFLFIQKILENKATRSQAGKKEEVGIAFALMILEKENGSRCNQVMTCVLLFDEATKEDDFKRIAGSNSGGGT